MKAIVFHKHGDSQVLEYSQLPDPEPGPGEVLVRLEAAALNGVDIWVRKGWPGLKLTFPHIPGADGAGEVTAVGDGVAGWTPGDQVVINSNLSCGQCEFCLDGYDNRCVDWDLLGETRRGTYAQYVVVPAANLYPLLEGFDKHTATAGGLVYHTAWHSLITRGNLRPGESVLVVGASGGVNTASIDIAKMSGATVFVVGSNHNKLQVAASLGADHLIDRSKDENWSKVIYQMTGKRGVDVVVDNVGTTFPSSLRAVRKGGRILTVGNTGGPKFEFDNRFMFAKHISLIGSTMGTHTEFAKVMQLIFSGRLKPVLDRTFPLSDARIAQERLEKGEQLGKITLAIA
ncbi:MAG: zinc-binding dehydrogenase [Anaerolineales bacterium]|nr:zinc-binding dehydrogenase [Anaerolineales bacterium]